MQAQLSRKSKDNRQCSVSFKRPKRCYICHAMVKGQNYNGHFQECCKIRKAKVEAERKAKQSQKCSIKRPSIREMIEQNPVVIRKKETRSKNPSINFRIKSIKSSSEMKEKTGINTCATIEKNKNSQIFLEEKGTKSQLLIGQKSQNLPKQQIKFTKKETENQNPQRQLKKLETIRYGQNSTTNLRGQIKGDNIVIFQKNQNETVEEYRKIESQEEQIKRQNDHGIEEKGRIRLLSEQDPIAANNTFKVQESNQQPQQQQEEQIIQRNGPIPPSTDYSSNSSFSHMIRITSQIIQFIERVGLQDDPTLSMMIQQLKHVNQISQQIEELSQIGNSVGFTMETLFGNRIQQLQQVILSQVSFAIFRSFNDERSDLFEGLLARNPQLRKGFTKEEVKDKFPEQLAPQDSQCAICLQDIEHQKTCIFLQCLHNFHKDCIYKWFETSKNCPMCRRQQK